MSDDSRVQELLEKALDLNSSPEEVCRDDPELLPDVRAEWERVRIVQAEIDALFPTPQPETKEGSPRTPVSLAKLPQIPGYKMEAILGHGGMGVVYKAHHMRLDRPVAIKMLLSGEFAAAQERTRFEREAKAVAAVRHPNVVQVYEVGDFDGRPYFSMELVEGQTLSKRLSGAPLRAADAAALAATLADAVQAAHDRSIVHRDLKPANVLLTPDGTPKISDFGLALRLDDDATLTLGGARLGTPSYMAPEQAMGKGTGSEPSADIYSLGALLYEMLTGRPPFRAESPAETQRQVISEEPAPPRRLNARIPRDLETICLKCLRKNPDGRYSSASALAEDLRRFLNQEPIHARPIGRIARLLRWARRKPTAAALVATALAMIAVILVGGALLVQQRAERRFGLHGDIGAAVVQARSLRQKYYFDEARELLRQADQRLGRAAPNDLRQQVTQAAGDLELVADLDRARQRVAVIISGGSDRASAEPVYREVFARTGLGGPEDESEAVAARVHSSPVRAEIIGVLDDWAGITQDDTRRAWLLSIARGADPEPDTNQLRRPELWYDGAELANLALEQVQELSPQLLTAFGRILNTVGGADPIPLLRAAQARFPHDYWINFELGWAWYQSGKSDEALGFYRAAIALRPEASSAHQALGLTLTALHRLDEAVAHFEQALDIDPTFALAHNNFGVALIRQGRFDEAIAHWEEAIRLNVEPGDSAGAYANLGTALRAKGRLDDAIEHFEKSIQLYPEGPLAHFYLGDALHNSGRFSEAIIRLREALRLDPHMLSARSALRDSLFDAACLAVRASVDHGLRETRFGDVGPADLRRQALNWLRANLELTATMLEDGTAGWGASLSAWQIEPALAGVRDRAALAELPDTERRQWERLWADVEALRAAEPGTDGWTHAARRDWDKATKCYARDLKFHPTELGNFWFAHAALLLLSGDRTGYTQACARMVELFREGSSIRAYHVARACTLAPDAGAEVSLLGRLAETELMNSAEESWSLTQQGALQFRAGRFPEAVALFELSLVADSRPGRAVLNWLWLALANERLGELQEARRWLNMATTWLDQFTNGMPSRAEEFGLHMHNWLEAHILRSEAEAAKIPN